MLLSAFSTFGYVVIKHTQTHTHTHTTEILKVRHILPGQYLAQRNPIAYYHLHTIEHFPSFGA